MRKVEQNKRDIIIVATLSIIVFFVCFYRISYRYGIFLPHDEFALFGIAAYLSGYDWSAAVSGLHYYSFGYSLLLTPLFMIADSAVVAYRYSMVLNSVFAAGIVPIAFFLCKKWGIEGLKGNIVIAFGVLAAILTGDLIAYTSLGFGEVLLTFLMFATLLCFYKIQENAPKSLWFCLLALLLGFQFMVHMRTIGVLIASVLTILLMTALRKISIKNFIIFFGTLALLLLIRTVIEENIQPNLWLDTTPANTLDDRVGRFTRSITRLDRIIGTLRTLGGHLFYLGVASFSLIFFALHKLASANISFFRNLKKTWRNTDFDFALMFMLLAFLGTLAISAFALNSPSRGDHFVYGRYNTPVFPALFLYIFVQILIGNYKFSKATVIIFTAFALLSGWVAFYFIQNFSDFPYAHFGTIALVAHHEYTNRAGSEFLPFLSAFLISAFIGFVIIFVQKIMTAKRKDTIATVHVYKQYIISIVCIICIVISVTNASAFYNADPANWDSFSKEMNSLTAQIPDDATVYILNPPSYMFSILQFELFKNTLHHAASYTDLPNGGFYLFLDDGQRAVIQQYLYTHGTYLDSFATWNLYRIS